MLLFSMAQDTENIVDYKPGMLINLLKRLMKFNVMLMITKTTELSEERISVELFLLNISFLLLKKLILTSYTIIKIL